MKDLIIENANELKLQVKAWCKQNGVTLKQASMMIWGNDWKLPRIVGVGLWRKQNCDEINECTGLKLVIKVGVKKAS